MGGHSFVSMGNACIYWYGNFSGFPGRFRDAAAVALEYTITQTGIRVRYNDDSRRRLTSTFEQEQRYRLQLRRRKKDGGVGNMLPEPKRQLTRRDTQQMVTNPL